MELKAVIPVVYGKLAGLQEGFDGMDENAVENAVKHWVSDIVIDLNLCPFARPVVQQNQLCIQIACSADVADCLQQMADVAASLVTSSVADATTLLVLPEGFNNFDSYLDLLALAEALFDDLGYSGHLQLASFHPDYCFNGVDADDPANYTNRAPYPMLHVLREASVSRAVERHPDPASIAPRNIERLRAMGNEQIRALLDK